MSRLHVTIVVLLVTVFLGACTSGAATVTPSSGNSPDTSKASTAGSTAPSNSSPTTSAAIAARTIQLDLSATPVNAQASTVVRLPWAPSTLHTQQGPEASAVFGVSPDGKTIALAEAPDRNSRNLHLYNGAGAPLLSRQLLGNIPHDSPFVALTDLAVVSPTDIFLLLQHEDSFRVHRLTPNETGMSTDIVNLTRGIADQLAVPDPSGSDVWAYDAAADRSYPVFLGGTAIWQDADQQSKARAGIPLGDSWVQMKREDAKITLTGAGAQDTWQLEIPAPAGERFDSARLLQPDASGLFYLVTEIRPASVGYSPGTIIILSFSADGNNHSQLTLADLRSSAAPQFAVTRDGTLYALESRPGALAVVTYRRKAWVETPTTTTTPPPTTSSSEPSTSPVAETGSGPAVGVTEAGFQPYELTVDVGETVTWKNVGTVPHHLVSERGPFDSGVLAPGATYSFTFAKVGRYLYQCSLHPSLTGVIVVRPRNIALLNWLRLDLTPRTGVRVAVGGLKQEPGSHTVLGEIIIANKSRTPFCYRVEDFALYADDVKYSPMAIALMASAGHVDPGQTLHGYLLKWTAAVSSNSSGLSYLSSDPESKGFNNTVSIMP